MLESLIKEGGSDGFVLTPEGCIDAKRVEELISLSQPLPVTFHRAFDMVKARRATFGFVLPYSFSFSVHAHY